jgi:hypothetical protein
VNHAVALAASEYEDVKSDAVRSLAGMATCEQSQRSILEGEGVKVVIECLSSFTGDVHRCAASTLANLLSAASPTIVSKARELVETHNGAANLFRLMLREKSEQQPDHHPVSPQVLRECARALIALYKDSPHRRYSAVGWRVATIQKLRSHHCPTVREYAELLDEVTRV